MARKTTYKAEYAEQARKLCLLGATDQELGDFFGVSEKTINTWKKQHPEFLQSIKKGKDVADAEVADRLFQRAMGFEHDDTHISNYLGKISKTKIKKVYPPDTAAGIFWLKNRQSKKWRDKQDHEVTGKDGGPVQLSDIERAKRITAILDAARARRAGQPDIDERPADMGSSPGTTASSS